MMIMVMQELDEHYDDGCPFSSESIWEHLNEYYDMEALVSCGPCTNERCLQGVAPKHQCTHTHTPIYACPLSTFTDSVASMAILTHTHVFFFWFVYLHVLRVAS